MVGTESPYTRDGDDAVTVTVRFEIATLPSIYENE
jgi:hypothetical protein